MKGYVDNCTPDYNDGLYLGVDTCSIKVLCKGLQTRPQKDTTAKLRT